MATLFARYRHALGFPGMARTMSATFVAYLLAGMINLSLLLATERITGNYAAAGLVAGSYAAALAFAAPAWGRFVDRRGPRLPLVLAPSLLVVMVAAFVAVALTIRTPALLAITACLAGACTPPTASVARRTMTGVGDEEAQRTLFAISGFMSEFVFVVGPLVVAMIVAFVNPLWAIGVAALASGAGALLMRGSAPARELDRAATRTGTTNTERTSGGQPASWNAEQVRVFVVIALGAFAIGGVQVSVVVQAQDLGASAGALIAALAIGGTIASFLYGGLSLPGSLPVHLVVCLGIYGLLILSLTTAPCLVISALLLLLIGAATGPADGIEAMLIGKYSPPAVQAQAFAVLITANWIGFAIGSAVCGALIQSLSHAAGAIAAGAGALCAAALVLVPLRRTAPAPAAIDENGQPTR